MKNNEEKFLLNKELSKIEEIIENIEENYHLDSFKILEKDIESLEYIRDWIIDVLEDDEVKGEEDEEELDDE